VTKKCEYCNEKLDYAYLYDAEIDIVFCHDCRNKYIDSLSYSSIWLVFKRHGEVKEVFVGDEEHPEE
jgi:hypothetical protein